MKKILFVLCVTALFLAACVQQQFVCPDDTIVSDASLCAPETETEKPVLEEETPTEELEEETPLADAGEVVPKIEEPEEKTEYTVNQAELKAFKDSYTYSTKIKAFKSAESYEFSVGEKFPNIIAVGNSDGRDNDFSIEIQFLEAKSINKQQPLSADETVLSWIKPIANFSIERNGKIFLPLDITIGAAMDKYGTPSQQGEYVFFVKVTHYSKFDTWTEYADTKFYVRVK